MRLLVLNSNTSKVVTGKVEPVARAAASPGTEIVAVTGDFGPRVIGTRAENALAEASTLSLIARHGRGCDAALIAVSYDTGLKAARELFPIPIVGMTEAGLLTACMLGGRIGVITFGARVLPLYQEVIAGYGLASRIAAWRVIESAAAYQPGAHPELDRELAAAANDLVAKDYAEAILVTGAVMAGVPARLQPQVPVPIVDCIVAGVRQAEMLASLRFTNPRAGSFAFTSGRELVNADPAVTSAFARKGIE
jgi:allantoin racemase